jgi:nickel-dependent lactate racemase
LKHFSLSFGETRLSFTIPAYFTTDELNPVPVPVLENPVDKIHQVFKVPLHRLRYHYADHSPSIAIAINDKTRPVPNPNPLNVLLEDLNALGFEREKIALFVASGTHTPMEPSELPLILSADIQENYRIVVHDCDKSPMVDLGKTSRQTPIKINADYYQSEIKIIVGNIEPHHFMGFSGGAKGASIGLASRETIEMNHALLAHPQATTGVFHHNPMRQEVEEIGKKIDLHYCLGTILNEDKEIIDVFFSNPSFVMNAAIPKIKQVFGASAAQPYDLVIASPGGAPKDINLYQAQKGLTHAARITKDGGWVILIAACPEGTGSASFEDYARAAQSQQAILDHFDQGFFQVGPHKAFQIARDALRVNIVLVSEIPPKEVKQWKMTPSPPHLLQSLIDWILNRLPEDARIAILPAATRTMTEVSHE